jgi:DNA-binding response OmpR family regulator
MRILVVDDNRDAANMLAVLLREEGYDVDVICTAHDALSAARTRPPRVVPLDIGMPVMDGFELAAALRNEECCRGCVLIAIRLQ